MIDLASETIYVVAHHNGAGTSAPTNKPYHDLHALELLRTAGQFVGVLVGDEGRRPAAHQPHRYRQPGEVVPQTVEVGNLADVVVPPGPGAVIQPA